MGPMSLFKGLEYFIKATVSQSRRAYIVRNVTFETHSKPNVKCFYELRVTFNYTLSEGTNKGSLLLFQELEIVVKSFSLSHSQTRLESHSLAHSSYRRRTNTIPYVHVLLWA